MKNVMHMILIAAAVSAACSATAHAGQEVGNGGNVVVWDTPGEPTDVAVLDYWEAENELGFKIDLGDYSLPVLDKVKIALKRLERLSPYRALLLGQLADSFMDETALIPAVGLVPIQDSLHIVVPRNGKVVQAAIQKQAEFPGQKMYTISKDLWDLMSNDEKAGLILHEILYRQALQAGAKDSVGTRYLNALISSHEIEKLDVVAFASVAHNIPLDWVEFGGFKFRVDEKYPQTMAPFFVGGPIVEDTFIGLQNTRVPTNAIYFSNQAKISMLFVTEPVMLEFEGYPLVFSGPLWLRPDQSIRRGKISADSVFEFDSDSYTLKPDPTPPETDSFGHPLPRDYWVMRDAQDRITECASCRGWVVVGGRTFHVVGDASKDHHPSYYRVSLDEPASDYGTPGLSMFLGEKASFDLAGGQKADFIGPLKFSDLDAAELASGQLAAPTALQIRGRAVTFSGMLELDHFDRTVRHGVLGAPAELEDVQGKLGTYPAGVQVWLDGQGRIIAEEGEKK